jgi:hypothetical protein
MAWEWLEKYLKGGMATQGVPDMVGGEVPTRGLFGTGGEYGQGGLLTTFNQPSDPGKGMLNLFSNLPVMTGLEMIQGGMTGKPIEQTLLPAFKSGLTTTTAVEKVKASKRKRDYINKYKDQVPKKDMELFLAFPEKYISAMLSEKLRKTTLGDEAVKIFQYINSLPAADQAKAISGLPKIQQDLYKKYIRQQFNLVEELLVGSLKSGDGGIKSTWKIGDVITKKDGSKAKVTQVDENGKILAVEEIIK